MAAKKNTHLILEKRHQVNLPKSSEYRVKKIVAVTIHSRLGDALYGQCLMLHVLFRHPMDFIDEELLSKVPPEHRCFTVGMYCHHPIAVAMWTHEAAIEHELMIEGHTKKHSESIW